MVTQESYINHIWELCNYLSGKFHVADSPRLMQLLQSRTPPMSVSQTVCSDMPSDAQLSSDEDESHSGTRSSPYVNVHSTEAHPAVTESFVRSSGMHSRPVQTGPICTSPGIM